MSNFTPYRSTPYIPYQKIPYKISRSKIDLFIDCSRCFWLDARLKISRPKGPPFTLNSAVDYLLKLEFDALRADNKQHPLQTQYGIDARPCSHPKLNIWRENFKGVQTLHKATNLTITGAIDDLWQDSSGKYIVVDYKATSKMGKIEELGTEKWHDQYRRQLEVYQWLLKQNKLNVNNTGYWVYCNAKKDRRGFDGRLEFEITLLSYEGNDSWIEPKLYEIKKVLDSDDIPLPNRVCEFCGYIKQQKEAFIKLKSSK